MQLNTYLNYGGNWAKRRSGSTSSTWVGASPSLMRHGEQPGGSPALSDWKDKVLHAQMDLGGTALMGADIPADRFQPMRSAYLSLTVGSTQEAERVYALLTDGVEIMPMEETFATRFAMLRDRFGTSWMLPIPQAGRVMPAGRTPTPPRAPESA